jgi:N-acetylglucosaminyldiphosphoundecaprenol N-acetyl-beta-D-mannosaminyltransferase
VWGEGLRALARKLQSLRAAGPPPFVACLNPHSVVTANRDPAFLGALHSADVLLPDGVGILLGARLLGTRIVSRVTGSDLFHLVCSEYAARGRGRFFLFGSLAETLQRAAERLGREWPALDVVGTLAPPFKVRFSSDENHSFLKTINSCRPDVLWVCLGAPKQELWVRENMQQLHDLELVGAIGAAIDFYAWSGARAGASWRRVGLEWLPRLARNPRRLWRRTLVSAPVFLWTVVRERLSRATRGR